ncbi:hypothetical protein Tco_0454280 [Tanacetum coccineum]
MTSCTANNSVKTSGKTQSTTTTSTATNRKGFLEDDESSDDSIFIVDQHPNVTIPLRPDFGGVTDGTKAKVKDTSSCQVRVPPRCGNVTRPWYQEGGCRSRIPLQDEQFATEVTSLWLFGNQGHYRSDCPKLRSRQGLNAEVLDRGRHRQDCDDVQHF